jgi:hypothetical protein
VGCSMGCRSGGMGGPSSSSSSSSEGHRHWQLWACYGAATVARRASHAAFQDKKRAMTAPDVIGQLMSCPSGLYRGRGSTLVGWVGLGSQVTSFDIDWNKERRLL